ncbi:hypothetical protein CRE_14758 [Caenorhabditis remanei]|uniref:Uncharacterized protein n=1 Tax=Caenorhabditis remanei TaxID=31234 RepID=E3MRS0_CAERE|nr:hypothetical protein CRE_14758 [Caenorhabditis remanei]
MSKRSLKRLENTRIGKLREIVVDTPTLIQMMVAIEKLVEMFGFDREQFFQAPNQYRRLLLSFQLYNFQERTRMRRDELEKLSHACDLNFITRLDKILKLDHLDCELTLKEFILQIRSIESTSNFFSYLRSTAIVLGNLVDFESHLSTFMILILCPLQRYFIVRGAVCYVGLLGYHGKPKIPDDLTTFVKKKEDFTTTGVPTNAAIRNFPFHQHSVLHLAMLVDPYKSISRDVVHNRIKNDFFLKVSRPQYTPFRYLLSQKYEHKIGDEVKYKLRIDCLDETRNSLYVGYLCDHKKMEDYGVGEKQSINHMYDFGFGLISKWEIAYRLVKKMFGGDTDPIDWSNLDDSGVDMDGSPSPVGPLSIDVAVDTNQGPPTLAPNLPIKLEEAEPTIRGYHLLPINPPPVGWENDPAWKEFNFSSVTYQGQNFSVNTVTVFPSGSNFQSTSEMKNASSNQEGYGSVDTC